eukprot:scaffold54261_cov60-Phaeocystis_antarctica.AAC.1
MEVTLVGASWDVVAGDQTGVDFIPMKFCGVPSCLALGVGATIAAYHPPAGAGSICQRPWVGRRAAGHRPIGQSNIWARSAGSRGGAASCGV